MYTVCTNQPHCEECAHFLVLGTCISILTAVWCSSTCMAVYLQAELEARSHDVQASQQKLQKSEEELKRCEQQLRESRVRCALPMGYELLCAL